MHDWRVALAALALGTSAVAVAAPADAPNPLFTGRDLFNLSAAADPQISPDGRRIAYVRRTAEAYRRLMNGTTGAAPPTPAQAPKDDHADSPAQGFASR